MRALGVIIFLVGSASAALGVVQALQQGRPRDLLFALVATLCALLAVLGLVLTFVPGFLGG